MKKRVLFGGIVIFGILTACNKEKTTIDASESAQSAAPAPAAVTAGPGPIEPQSGGKVIVVTLTSNEKGNFFEPAEVEAHSGDVVRFKLNVGVHNIHFLPDSNTVKTGLPPASDMLQLPGQTYDVLVNFPKGKYYFQCDPHAALGMKGHLEVED